MIPESEGEKDSEAPSVLNQQGSSDKNRQGFLWFQWFIDIRGLPGDL